MNLLTPSRTATGGTGTPGLLAPSRITGTPVPGSPNSLASSRFASLPATTVQTFSYDADNRLLSTTSGSVTTTFTYDANGSMTGRSSPGETLAYVWDTAGRLSSITRNGSTQASFTGTCLEAGRDGDGNRRSKTSGSTTTTNYVNDARGLSQVLQAISSTKTVSYVGNAQYDSSRPTETEKWGYTLAFASSLQYAPRPATIPEPPDRRRILQSGACRMDPKQAAEQRIAQEHERLVALSHRMYAAPEIAWEEEHACRWLADLLADDGFVVQTGVYDLSTAFVARTGTGPLHLAICAEYDALPDIGHACGHNIIAASALGAAFALRELADDLGLTISVIGTPAEEVLDSGGKILLLERGAFAGVNAAMMVHPGPSNVLQPNLIAATMFDVRYAGTPAHAGAFPHLGVNAADAMVVAQTAIGLLRQQLRPTDRVHGIVTHGGDAPNVIPANTAARYCVRASVIGDLVDVRDKVFRCFEAGALATGATLTLSGGEKPYAEGRWDSELSAIFGENARSLEREFIVSPMPASTDMGNISHVIPTIHPMIGIDSLPAVNHQPEFAACTVTPAGDRAIRDGATSMAWTAIDIATNATVRSRMLSHSV